MEDCRMALHQRFCKEPECQKVRKGLAAVHQGLRQVLDRREWERLLKLADLENELQDETSLESFLSGFKLALGIAAELAPAYSLGGDEEQRACEKPSDEGGRNNGRKAGQRRGKHLQAEGRTLGRPVHRRVRPGRQADHQERAGQDPGGGQEQAVCGHCGEPSTGRAPLREIHGGGIAASVVRVARQAQHPPFHSRLLSPGYGRVHHSPNRNHQAEQVHQLGDPEAAQESAGKWAAAEKAEEETSWSQRIYGARRPRHAPQCPGPGGEGAASDSKPCRQVRGIQGTASGNVNSYIHLFQLFDRVDGANSFPGISSKSADRFDEDQIYQPIWKSLRSFR